LSVSIGVDIVEIDRIRRVVETHGERFLKRVYAPAEVSFCSKRADRAACLAARFAAKEAFRKAVASAPFVAWREILVVSGKDGAPSIQLPADVSGRLGGTFCVSLSHSREHAVAVVLWEKHT
jgi:holo-[acyl-carrier protein] synthase